MLLCLWSQCSIINDGAVRDRVRTVVDGNRCGHEIFVGVLVAGANFCELAVAAGNGVLMAVGAGSGVEYRAEAGAGVVVPLEAGLVECVGIARGFLDTVANALRAGILRERRSVKACGSFGCRLLSNSSETDGRHSDWQENESNALADHSLPPGQIEFTPRRLASPDCKTAKGIMLFPDRLLKRVKG